MKFMTTKKQKIAASVGSALTTMAAFSPMAFAMAGDAEGALSGIFENVKELVATIFKYIGAMLLVWGVAQLILAFKNEDADSKSRAMLLIGVSAALIGISAFIDMVVGDVL